MFNKCSDQLDNFIFSDYVSKTNKNKKITSYLSKRLSINDVTFLWGMGQLFCDDSTIVLLIKALRLERGVKNSHLIFLSGRQ